MNKSILTVWVILFIVAPILSFSQSRQITGTITTANGDPLPFATILQKGTTNGTSADNAGKFSITVSGDNPVLIISATGYAPQELSIGSANDYTVGLTNTGGLDEVVVTALGISRKQKSVGYSTQQVKGENLTLT